MTHLNDEQLDAVIAGEAAAPPHLADCPQCAARLTERQAVARRLQAAFQSVRASPALARRVEAAVRPATGGAWRARLVRIGAGVAVAAGVIIAVSALVRLGGADEARAELLRIHQANLSSGVAERHVTDPAELAERFRREAGFEPALPCPCQEHHLCGYCEASFRGRPAGSYVIETPEGTVSVVVISESPGKLGLKRKIQVDGQAVHCGSANGWNLAATRLGDHTYCAVGKASEATLASLVGQLTPPLPAP